MSASNPIVDEFVSAGVNATKAAEVAKKEDLTAALRSILASFGFPNEYPAGEDDRKRWGSFAYQIVSSKPRPSAAAVDTVLPLIKDGSLESGPQLTAALAFVASPAWTGSNMDDLKKAAGVGVSYTREQIQAAVDAALAANMAALREQRYHFVTGKILGTLTKTTLPWSDGPTVSEILNASIAAILGPKTAEDEKKPVKKEAVKAEGSNTAAAAAAVAESKPSITDVIEFPDPKDNVQVNPKLLADHLKATGGKVVTRFPPEPNGYLHIGHCKSMNLNFGYAKAHGGTCILRFDDTNPNAEKIEFIEEIKNSVKWMGHEPVRVTAASDYFQEQYDFAVQLIKQGDAYVDHQTPEDIKLYRAERRNSPWRDRPIEESLKLFEDMRKGKISEGAATLRLKMDMQSENPCMRDLVAYRVLFSPHPLAGDKWCVYPSYDFEHCIIDALENITHSLCTLEFVLRRESYNWLLDKLGLYKAVVWEYSRLNITHTVISKRKLIALVDEGHVRGWDDPRMPTINALRRKGYTPTALEAFCIAVGISRTENLVEVERLEACIRAELNENAPRNMLVIDPLPVTITNWEANRVATYECPVHPAHPERGTYTVPLTSRLYLEKSDFRTVDDKNFFGLAPNKTIRLKYGPAITCTSFATDAAGNVISLEVRVDEASSDAKLKTLHWVSDPAPGVRPVRCEVRLYDHLFMSEDVGAIEGDWRADINPTSLVVHKDAYAAPGVATLKVEDKFQAERNGYFCVDPDSTLPTHIVLNRTCTLKESNTKGEAGSSAPAKK